MRKFSKKQSEDYSVMNKSVFGLLAAAVLLTSCVTRSYRHEEHVSKLQKTSAFEQVYVHGSPTVYYEQGDSMSVRIEGTSSMVNEIETYVTDSVLNIGYKNHSAWKLFNFRRDDGELRVYVTSPDLVGVQVVGSGDFICRQPLDTDVLTVRLEGSGDVTFASIVCDKIEAAVMGSGDMRLGTVTTQSAGFNVTGSGDLDAQLKNARQTDISVIGSGDAKVDFANCGSANASVCGSGDVVLSGSLQHYSMSKLGSGDIDTKHLKVQ